MQLFETKAALLATTICWLCTCHLAAALLLFDDHHDWTYNEQYKWNQKCASGDRQSPIDINRQYVMQNPRLQLKFYNYDQHVRFKLKNAHHTIMLSPIDFQEAMLIGQVGDHNNTDWLASLQEASDVNNGTSTTNLQPTTTTTTTSPSQATLQRHGSRLQVNAGAGGGHLAAPAPLGANQQQQIRPNPALDGRPAIKLEWFDDGNNEFYLHGIHFHWNERRDNGSEHAIDGRRAAMEMHLVHIRRGLDPSSIGFSSDSIVVIGVLIESYRKSNADFNPIVNSLSRINMTNDAQEIEYKNLFDLLPSSLNSFYTYSGSLTTPPCHEVVNWVVMNERIYLNAKQMELFRTLNAPDGHEEARPIMPNVRNLQLLGSRVVMASFSVQNGYEKRPVGSPSVPSQTGRNQHHQQQQNNGRLANNSAIESNIIKGSSLGLNAAAGAADVASSAASSSSTRSARAAGSLGLYHIMSFKCWMILSLWLLLAVSSR